MQPRIRRAFLIAAESVRDSIDLDELTAYLTHGQYAAASQAVAGEAAYQGLVPVLQRSLLMAAQSELSTAGTLLGSTLHFDAYSPTAVKFAQDFGAKLVREITVGQKTALQSLVGQSLADGTPPADTARAIRDLVGLTESQQNAVQNYRAGLESNSASPLGYELRDKRFDRSVARNARRLAGDDFEALPQDRIDTMVDRYAARYLNYRANAIARTESTEALSVGNRMAWEQVVADGHVQVTDLYRRWYLGDKPCEICEPIPAMNPEGVGLREAFATPEGPLMDSPAHTHCVCVVFTRPK